MNEKKLYHIYNRELDIDHYLRLSDNEYAFYKWLRDRNYFYEDTCIERINEIPTIVEF